MLELTSLVILGLVACGVADDGNTLSEKIPGENRQRRLLFYDEQGNLPSSFSGSTIAYMIPVSDAVVQQINTDPVYQNKLMMLSTRDPLVEANPLCSGKREPIPSQKLCSNFINCWDGWAFEQECPDGLLFSNNGYCDYAYNVDCSNRKLKDTIVSRCRQDYETFRNETNCNEFYVCVNSLPVRFKCPSDLYFNQHLGVCDYKHIVSCNISLMESSDQPSSNTPQSTTATATYTTKATTPMELSTAPTSSTTGAVHQFINTYYDSKTWTATHVAMSRQDAIRQLKLKAIADVKTAE
ncbi:hypothetical protein RR48_11705 [Papilio machaon]|uniref:Chitin-binding type-2 domain-containing protein n=1 Tax=Papilio machaon TaxID=76193 RepID=A0A194QM93_PAPMA|nr:hypothetical protein RR48_11705 [Papilio machaon]